jgi:hypothetical protein
LSVLEVEIQMSAFYSKGQKSFLSKLYEKIIGHLHHNFFFFFFSFLTCSHKRGRGIRTKDLRFMRRGPQPIELPIGDPFAN